MSQTTTDQLREILKQYGDFVAFWTDGTGNDAPGIDEDTALARLTALLAAERLDELKQLMAKHTRTYRQTVTDSNGDVYVDDSHGYISKYETQERIEQLKKQAEA